MDEGVLAAAFAALEDPVSVWSADGGLIYWNDAYLKVHSGTPFMVSVGMTFSDVLNLGLALELYDIGDMSPEAYVADQARRRNALEPREFPLNDGRWMMTRTRRTADGGLVSVMTDITRMKTREAALTAARTTEEILSSELRSAARELERARLEAENARLNAEAASRAKTQLLARVSHELRTPLNAIIGFSEILEQELFGPLGDPRYVDYSKDIHQSGAHLLVLINDIIDLSRLESGSYRLEDAPLDLVHPIEASMRLVRQMSIRKSVELVNGGADAPWVMADERALRQILINLLSNAVKFTRKGGSVVVRAAGNVDAGVDIIVRDNGVGIPAEDLHRLGEPFVRASNTETASEAGTGLGLAIVRSLTELLGGQLLIESDLGTGTTVTVRLPASRVIAGASTLRPWFVGGA
jgi:two-component system, cell cycle sensor histidine kinase PleC